MMVLCWSCLRHLQLQLQTLTARRSLPLQQCQVPSQLQRSQTVCGIEQLPALALLLMMQQAASGAPRQWLAVAQTAAVPAAVMLILAATQDSRQDAPCRVHCQRLLLQLRPCWHQQSPCLARQVQPTQARQPLCRQIALASLAQAEALQRLLRCRHSEHQARVPSVRQMTTDAAATGRRQDPAIPLA